MQSVGSKKKKKKREEEQHQRSFCALLLWLYILHPFMHLWELDLYICSPASLSGYNYHIYVYIAAIEAIIANVAAVNEITVQQ